MLYLSGFKGVSSDCANASYIREKKEENEGDQDVKWKLFVVDTCILLHIHCKLSLSDPYTVRSETSADHLIQQGGVVWSYGWQNGTVFFGSSGFFTAMERKNALNYFFFFFIIFTFFRQVTVPGRTTV